MDTQTPVDDQILAGQKFITLLVHRNFDVVVACWVKTSDEENVYLYIASKKVDKNGLAGAYREAYDVLQMMETPWISASQLKLVRSDDPIVDDVKKTQNLLSDAFPTVSHRPQLGNISTNEVYIYATVDPDKVWLRQEFSVTYVKKDDGNTWDAVTRQGELYRGMRANGAVSYTTASYGGEQPDTQRFAIVTVLVEIDPKFDDRATLEHPDMRRMLVREARRLADEMFNARHPDASIQPSAESI